MGSGFFKPKQAQSSNLNMEARAIGSNAYGARQSSSGAAKDVAAAKAIGASGTPLKKMDRSAAYPPGPKKV
jgi:hypothetical protein